MVTKKLQPPESDPTNNRNHLIFAFLLCLIFFAAYTVLSIVNHNHYQSFGFDLGINDQVVWRYSQFKAPITTIDHIPFISKLNVHVEIIYALLSPFYWLWSDARMLLILESAFVCSSGLAVYLLARHYKLHPWLQFALLFTYLIFYGVQNALWFGVHSATFGAAFTSWFIYFLICQKKKLSVLFFILAITSKENIAGITLLISISYGITTRKKEALYFAAASLLYLAVIFGIYFPQFVSGGYRFANHGGFFSKFNPLLLIDTQEKRGVYLYTFLSYGFLPLLSPLLLLPVLGNLASYFILGSDVTTAQGLFYQYRIELVPLMSWAAIAAIAKNKKLNTRYTAAYLVICALVVQYLLHLPLSYLSKKTFWNNPSGVANIETIIRYVPADASLVSQNNITPHVSDRDEIFTLWPEKRDFAVDSPCGTTTCDWFRWAGNPQYLIVDTSPDWDIRHLLADRSAYLAGLTNLERGGIIQPYKTAGNAKLYKILKKNN